MLSGLVGKKLGMTRIFTKEGASIPVTVVEISPNKITQIKATDTDGYNAVQVTCGEKKLSRVTKSIAGHFAKAKVVAGKILREFRFGNAADMSMYAVGQEIKASDVFKDEQLVHVTATSKGKGFAGVIKRWNFSSQRMTHGNSLSHRAPGSIGQCQDPGRVFKGKKMAGQLGNEQVTVKNLTIVKVDEARNALLIKGAVPGSIGSYVVVRHLDNALEEGVA